MEPGFEYQHYSSKNHALTCIETGIHYRSCNCGNHSLKDIYLAISLFIFGNVSCQTGAFLKAYK